MRTRPASAFTLIELVIVMAIVGILAVLAVGSSIGNRPRTRLVAAASEIRLTLLQARTQAVRTDANHKICIFKDATPLAAPDANAGKVLIFRCGTDGLASCPGAAICNDVDASDPTLFPAAAEDCGDVTKWCLLNDVNALQTIDLGAGARADENVSIHRFLDATGADAGRNSIEITYQPNGILDRVRSSGASGSIELVNHDQCLPTIASCSSFINAMRINYNTGGGARLTE